MSPVSAEGHAVVRDFIVWMAGGAIAAVILLIVGFTVLPFGWVLALIAFVGCAAYGAWKFIAAAQSHGDHQHTVEDYESGRVQNT
ncbi:hypothetical protein [Devosia sp. CN2-171]|jgi:hypothetical protein|uniref:hypothetical protein n=1 Tax=Devosia sp. CN2-171 TaxID=3400909 RepID=UPI003BF77765